MYMYRIEKIHENLYLKLRIKINIFMRVIFLVLVSKQSYFKISRELKFNNLSY